MKTLFSSVVLTLVLSNSTFAGAGTLFKGGIGLPDWGSVSSNSAKTPPAAKAVLAKSPPAHETKFKRTDHRISTR